MRLYFLRHAHAEPGLDDRSRPLSAKGVTQCTQIGRFCRQAGIVFDAAFTSPLIRARDTAERVLQVTNAAGAIDLKAVNVLLNETSPSQFHDWLRKLPEQEHVLLVGHAPSLEDHARSVLGMERESSLNLPKAGLVCVSLRDPQQGALKFMVSPKVL